MLKIFVDLCSILSFSKQKNTYFPKEVGKSGKKIKKIKQSLRKKFREKGSSPVTGLWFRSQSGIIIGED